MAAHDPQLRMVLKWTASIVCAVWMALSIYQEFFDVNPDQYGFRSPEVEARMHACGGNFHQRYECKEAAILAKGRDSFIIWMEKVSIVFGPPALLSLLFRFGMARADAAPPPRRPPQAVAKRRVR